MTSSSTKYLLAATLLAAVLDPRFCVAQSPGSVPTVAVGDEPVWLRQLAQLSAQPDPESRLTIAVDGTVSLYLNGQRLAKDLDVRGTAASWEVGSLLRQGRNSVAIAVDGNQPGGVGVWLDGQAVPQLPVQNWKTITTAPPVGWQKTDFNDRDWKPATAGSTFNQQQLAALNAKQLSWVPNTGASRIVDGFVKFRDGDHVLLLGGTFVERAQSFGHLEAALSCSTADNVTFRNLGWSADTVFAESRGIFDSPAKGYERMIEHVRAEEPNVVFVCYGQNEAMTFANDEAGIERYKQQLAALCKDLGTTAAEVVLLSPHPFLDLQKPYPSPARWNGSLEKISKATQVVAQSLDLHYVDLFSSFVDQLQSVPADNIGMMMIGSLPDHPDIAAVEQQAWSDNGMHWNEDGYRKVAHVVRARIAGLPADRSAIEVDMVQSTVKMKNGSVRNITADPDGKIVEFEVRSDKVDAAPVMLEVFPRNPDTNITATLVDDSQNASSVDLIAAEKESSQAFAGFLNPDFNIVRQLTIRKNELYFHRWRPQNITYLFGFRKHEQGNNASEIAQFDPLIAELENKIAKAKQPQWHKIIIQEARGN